MFALAQPESISFSIIEPKFSPLEKTIFYQLGENKIPITILQYGDVKDVVYINVHDDETTSVEAAK